MASFVQDADDEDWPVKSGQVSNGFTTGFWRVQDSEPEEHESQVASTVEPEL